MKFRAEQDGIPMNMNKDEQQAYEWAIKQKFQSVAADYARKLAQYIKRADKDYIFNCALYEAQFKIVEGLREENKMLRGKVEHALSFDETASHFEHGEDRSWESLTDAQKLYWIVRANTQAPIGSLRVWNVINPPSEPVWYPVKTPEEGARLIDQLANEQVKDDAIHSNAFGLCEWDGEEWTEWYDDEGNDIDEFWRKTEK